MIEAVGERVLADLLRDPRPAARPRRPGRRCRRSRWRTTGCWPPATRTPGSRSTSSPAGSSRRCEAIERDAGRPHVAARHRAARPSARTTRETLRLWRDRFLDAAGRGRGARLRRDLPPDVGVLPRVLRGRLPHRLPRRRPVRSSTRIDAVTAASAPPGRPGRAGLRGALPAAAPRLGRQRRRPGRHAAVRRGPSSPRGALRRLLWAPGELGLAQAYVTGELDVEGDLSTGSGACGG